MSHESIQRRRREREAAEALGVEPGNPLAPPKPPARDVDAQMLEHIAHVDAIVTRWFRLTVYAVLIAVGAAVVRWLLLL